MPASIDDLQDELEQLNASMSDLLTFQQEAAMMAQQAGSRLGDGGAGGGPSRDMKSLLLGAIQRGFKDPMQTVRDYFSTITQLGVNALTKLDQIQFSNFDSGRNVIAMFRELNAEDSEQLGGIYNNLQTVLYAQEQGINLEGEGNLTLRNQLTMLDKAGAQGKMLLQFTKDLRTRGFSQEDVRQNLEKLSNIGFQSIQSAQSQAKMLKRMEESMGITSLADSDLSKNLLSIHSDLVKNAPQEFKFAMADMINLIRLPEGTDQIIILESINAQLGDVEGQMNRMADEYALATTEGEKEAIKGQWYGLMERMNKVIEMENKKLFPDRDQRGPERSLILGRSLFAEMSKFLTISRAASAAIDLEARALRHKARPPGEFGPTSLGLPGEDPAQAWRDIGRITEMNLIRLNDQIAQKVGAIDPGELRNALFSLYFKIAQGVASSAETVAGALNAITAAAGGLTGMLEYLVRNAVAAAGGGPLPAGETETFEHENWAGQSRNRWTTGRAPSVTPAPGTRTPTPDPALTRPPWWADR